MDELSLNTKLEKLEEYVGYLKGYQRHSLNEIRDDHTLQGAIFHYLQLAIESAMDIGELIISGLRARKPEEMREVVEILAEQKIIPKDFAQRFASIAGFRNILVHEYAEVDLEIVHHHLQNDLADFDFYLRSITQYLQSKRKK